MLARLILNSSKLESLAGGLRQIAATCKSVLGQVKRHTVISEVETSDNLTILSDLPLHVYDILILFSYQLLVAGKVWAIAGR